MQSQIDTELIDTERIDSRRVDSGRITNVRMEKLAQAWRPIWESVRRS
ncbi:hypothetical protein Halru_2083 [Halovivax ruber XH-70]|uniref:Uncharacterized protein n=1 Tax=Halovivax ruber (strain DSM 18193 / JCM 13892 / XH-70) TaxID=797302 RepID=L0IAQ4_HALRX|nr:hypothetical protein [Halovivax ruber]AGB16675.1 hypothetical protein Halru_2083 [Halovivax ruber XH-70]